MKQPIDWEAEVTRLNNLLTIHENNLTRWTKLLRSCAEELSGNGNKILASKIFKELK